MYVGFKNIKKYLNCNYKTRVSGLYTNLFNEINISESWKSERTFMIAIFSFNFKYTRYFFLILRVLKIYLLMASQVLFGFICLSSNATHTQRDKSLYFVITFFINNLLTNLKNCLKLPQRSWLSYNGFFYLQYYCISPLFLDFFYLQSTTCKNCYLRISNLRDNEKYPDFTLKFSVL